MTAPCLHLPQGLVRGMLEHARAESPCECVGLLFGHGDRATRLVRAANVAERPKTAYLAKPEELLQAFNEADAAGDELVGIYHSHPAGPQTPSATDLQEARYPVPHLIIVPAVGVVRAFWFAGSAVAEVDLVVERTPDGASLS